LRGRKRDQLAAVTATKAERRDPPEISASRLLIGLHLARLPGPLATDPAGRFRPPVRTQAGRRPPAGPGWLHEAKHDGFRILVRKLGERVKVWSRRGADFTDRFATIAEAVRGLIVDRALIDGEAVVLRDDGRSDFGALMAKRGGFMASLIAFDLLRLEGDDWRRAPDRKAAGGARAACRPARVRFLRTS
jgi:ATP-dependent DNA ligase